MNAIREMLEECGIEKERLRMVNVSASGAVNLVEIIHNLVDEIKQLGPSPIGTKNVKLNEETPQ